MDDPSRRELTEQILGAEQDERRRIALFLHDGPVQSLSGIALMLDAAVDFIGQDRLDEARAVLKHALERHRITIGELRDLSFNLEPVVLRDQGLEPALRALTEQRGIHHGIRVELEVKDVELLGEKTQAALYQIVREWLDGAIRRGPPKAFGVRIGLGSQGVETVITDDAPGERRRRSFEALEERARTLGATVSFDHDEAGSTLRILLPRYAAAD
ncbi:MAG TPA: histidine kinase [Gaiellaceae bacterium]